VARAVGCLSRDIVSYQTLLRWLLTNLINGVVYSGLELSAVVYPGEDGFLHFL
jgi:hypothetical protein